MSGTKNIYLKLFISTFYLSAFTFGGGFVIIPLMKKKFVDELKWLEEEDMLNMVAIAQSSPWSRSGKCVHHCWVSHCGRIRCSFSYIRDSFAAADYPVCHFLVLHRLQVQ